MSNKMFLSSELKKKADH